MAHRFDAVVIGAGLGGLSAAASMAKRGLSVAVLEKHGVPGGYATSFNRGRFEFEVALHELSGVGSTDQPGPVYEYLRWLGVLDQLTFQPIPDLYRSIFPNHDVRLPFGWDAYQNTLISLFPHEAQGIRQLLELIRTVDVETRSLEEKFNKGQMDVATFLKVPVTSPNVLRYQGRTWKSVLTRYIKDPEAQAIISQYWGYVGMPPSKASFFYFALMLAVYIKSGAAYVHGRSQALSNAFVSAIEANGGKVQFNTKCSGIVVKSGRVVGVETASGEFFEGKVVISNSDPIHTTRMLPEEAVPASWQRRLQASVVGGSSINVYLGLDRSSESLGIQDHEVFVNLDYDQDEHFRVMHTLETPKAMCVTTYNICDPTISPPGTSSVVLTGLAYGAPWFTLDPSQYVATKRRMADGMLAMAERVVPDIRQCIEVMDISTPVTNYRYTGNYEGAIYGFEQPPWDATVWRLGHKGPVEGLFLVGAFTQPGGGFQPAIASGQMVAEEVMQGSFAKRGV